MNAREKIYNNVKALAKLNNEKLCDVENCLGVTAGYLSRVKHGLTIDNVEKLANHFNVTIDELINEDYWQKYRKAIATNELHIAVMSARAVMTRHEINAIVQTAMEGHE